MGASEAPELSPLPFNHIRNRRDGKVIFQLRIPIDCIGIAIGRGGCHVKEIESNTSTIIHFETRLMKETDRFCACTIIGATTGVQEARTKIQDIIFKHIRYQMAKEIKQEELQLNCRGKKDGKGKAKAAKMWKIHQDKPAPKKLPHVNNATQTKSLNIPKQPQPQSSRKSRVCVSGSVNVFSANLYFRRYCPKKNCGYSSVLQNKSDSHFKKVHLDPTKDRAKSKYMNSNRTDEPENSQREFSCSNCWRAFDKRKSYMNHLIVNHQGCDVQFSWSQRKKCFLDSRRALKMKTTTYWPHKYYRGNAIAPYVPNKFRVERIGFSSKTMSVTQKDFVLVLGPPLVMASTPYLYQTTYGVKQLREVPGIRPPEPDEKKQGRKQEKEKASLEKQPNTKKEKTKSQVPLATELPGTFAKTDRLNTSKNETGKATSVPISARGFAETFANIVRLKTSKNEKERAQSTLPALAAEKPECVETASKSSRNSKRPRPAPPEGSQLKMKLTATSEALKDCSNIGPTKATKAGAEVTRKSKNKKKPAFLKEKAPNAHNS